MFKSKVEVGCESCRTVGTSRALPANIATSHRKVRDAMLEPDPADHAGGEGLPGGACQSLAVELGRDLADIVMSGEVCNTSDKLRSIAHSIGATWRQSDLDRDIGGRSELAAQSTPRGCRGCKDT
jgi:hypothetical protein